MKSFRRLFAGVFIAATLSGSSLVMSLDLTAPSIVKAAKAVALDSFDNMEFEVWDDRWLVGYGGDNSLNEMAGHFVNEYKYQRNDNNYA